MLPKKTPAEQIADAYIDMAFAGHRPDGIGSVYPNKPEAVRLSLEAENYAQRFQKEENNREFLIGCSDYSTARPFVFAIEAARRLAAVEDDLAYKLLGMALHDLGEAINEKKFQARIASESRRLS